MEVMAAISGHPTGSANADLAVLCALLYDTIDDTDTSFETVTERFGDEVARGVLTL